MLHSQKYRLRWYWNGTVSSRLPSDVFEQGQWRDYCFSVETHSDPQATRCSLYKQEKTYHKIFVALTNEFRCYEAKTEDQQLVLS